MAFFCGSPAVPDPVERPFQARDSRPASGTTISGCTDGCKLAPETTWALKFSILSAASSTLHEVMYPIVCDDGETAGLKPEKGLLGGVM